MLAEGLSSIFKKLHQWRPNTFPETPTFLKKTSQKVVGEFKGKLDRKGP